MKYFTLALCLTAACVVSAWGTTLEVRPDGGGAYPTILAAIDAAASGDTVALRNGTFQGIGNRGIYYNGKSIVVRSRDGDSSRVIIDCQDLDFGFAFTNGEGPGSILEAITINDGNSTTGGGIYCVGSSPTITSCRIISCSADAGGGGLSCDNASPTVTYCIFESNRAWSSDGGGIYCQTGSAPTITGCQFTDNQGHHGGGLACSDASPILVDCAFTLNTTGGTGSGGAIYCVAGSDPTLLRCTVSNNSAGIIGDGGGIYGLGAGLSLDGCEFSGNRGNHGGAIILESALAADIVNSDFLDNYAASGGAGIYLVTANATTTITGCTFYADSTDDRGGGLYAYGGVGLRVEDCVFEDNYAESSGGGFLCDNVDSLWVKRCDFLGNSTWASNGGGLSIDSTVAEVDSCLFERNRAENPLGGGGLYVHAGENEITSCLFWENTGYRGGGLIMDSEGADTVRACTFADNQATTYGGGVRAEGENCLYHNCTFARNSAGAGGGLYAGGATLHALGVTSYGNTSREHPEVPVTCGGGIGSIGVVDITITGSLFAYDSTDGLGGAIGIRENGVVAITGTTTYGCHAETEDGASGVHLRDTAQGTAARTIVSYGTNGPGVICNPGMFTLTCTDIYGNIDGDWTGNIAGQLGVSGNISEDPLFCDAPGWESGLPVEYHFGLDSDSPCAPFSDPNPECDLIGTHGVACGEAAIDDSGSPVGPIMFLRHTPNPVHQEARITYSIPYRLGAPTANVHLAIYDATGRLVRSLVHEEQTVGIHDASWDGTDSSNRHTGAGVYLCRLQVGAETAVQRVICVE
jgi:predicted outer membrane repeat protein